MACRRTSRRVQSPSRPLSRRLSSRPTRTPTRSPKAACAKSRARETSDRADEGSAVAIACSRRSSPYRTWLRERLGSPTAMIARSSSGGGIEVPLGRGSRDVHHELAAAGSDDDDFRFLEPVVPLAVDLSWRQEDAVPLASVELSLPSGSALPMDLARAHVDDV